MSSELTEDNPYSRFETRNFGNVHAIVFYSSSSDIQYLDLCQQLEYAIKPSVLLAYADINQYPSAIDQFQLKQLPAVLIRANPSIIPERLLQISPTALFDLLPTVQADFKVAFEAEKVVQFEKCRKLIEDNPLMLFIKGTPEAPKCKFTRQMLKELRPLNIRFSFYDIDNDQSMRHWLKLYSKWNTFPQIFVNGKILGGLDVLLEQIKTGKFQDMISPECRVMQINSLPSIQILHPNLILHKGQPELGSELAKLLKSQGVDFQYYNISLDEVLFSQLDARGLQNEELLLKDNQLYTLEQAKTLSFTQ